MTNYEMMQIIDGIRQFPIGEIAADRQTLLSKAEVVSYLAPYQEQFENKNSMQDQDMNEIANCVRAFLGDIISLREGEKIPNIIEAERFLHLSPGFLQDYGKVQYMKEHHPEFSRLYDLIFKKMEQAKIVEVSKQI